MATASKFSLIKYLKESKQELDKVTWPTKKEVVYYSSVVIIVTLLAAVYFGVLDYLLALGLGALIG
jgi:preprotein translocase subunit SecE